MRDHNLEFFTDLASFDHRATKLMTDRFIEMTRSQFNVASEYHIVPMHDQHFGRAATLIEDERWFVVVGTVGAIPELKCTRERIKLGVDADRIELRFFE